MLKYIVDNVDNKEIGDLGSEKIRESELILLKAFNYKLDIITADAIIKNLYFCNSLVFIEELTDTNEENNLQLVEKIHLDTVKIIKYFIININESIEYFPEEIALAALILIKEYYNILQENENFNSVLSLEYIFRKKVNFRLKTLLKESLNLIK